jgi:L,D-transpeptidase YcbB
MRLMLRMLLVLGFCLALGQAAIAQDTGQVQAAITQLLGGGQRLALPLERVRPALTAHYVTARGSIYWVGTGRMDKFIQRIQRATYDGLNTSDYPVENLISLRDELDSNDANAAAEAELYFSKGGSKPVSQSQNH